MTTQTIDDTKLRSELIQLSPKTYRAIKDNYYAAAAAIQRLASELELADLDLMGDAEKRSQLLDLHLDACEVLTAFNKLDSLAKVL